MGTDFPFLSSWSQIEKSMTGKAHGDECPCPVCEAKRYRHEEIIARMQEKCPGCSRSQPFDGHCHTETGDLTSMMCQAMDERHEIDVGLESGTILRFHGWHCDCSMCLDRRRESPEAT